MSKILAIKGDKERGHEVIALLEMLGGYDDGLIDNGTDEKYAYFIVKDEDNAIDAFPIDKKEGFDFDAQIFTLDEFYKKHPFNVGDRVLIPEYESEVRINQMVWDGWDVEYMVYRNDDEEWYTATELKNWNDDFYDVETKVESTGFMQLGKTFAVIFNDANYEDEVELQLGDYEIEVRNGKTYAVRKKSVFPKTYDENWKLVPNKFDISNLKAYDKVLVRDANVQLWVADLFSHVLDKPLGGYTFACVGHYSYQCIPYEGNEHLLGTNNDCDEYYKNW